MDLLPAGWTNAACNTEALPLAYQRHIALVVPAAGLEPARPLSLRILSPLCLPFHHAGTAANIGKMLGV